MMSFALFLPASLRLGARLDEAETSAKPYRFTPCYLSWLGLAMRQSKSIGDGMTAEAGETLTPRDEGLRP
jgi:hypothetical protein